METKTTLAMALSILLFVTACDGTDGVDGQNGVDGVNGVDGANGVDGVDGLDGANGFDALLAMNDIAPGATCPYGGHLLQTGLDADGDGVLDAGEIDASQDQTLCNQTGSYTIGGNVFGLAADGSQMLGLQNLGADLLHVTASGSFAFATPLTTGSRYEVTVNSPPAGMACGLFAGRGTVGFAPVGDLVVTCQQQGTVTTLAGHHYDYIDGKGTDAAFASPMGLDVDERGFVYVADSDNNVVRRIAPDGEVSTLAGSGAYGYLDAQGRAALFSQPADVAVDRNGFVYVTDYSNQVIRKISPDGMVTTFAGSGTAGYRDGAGSTAQFWAPYGLAVDRRGFVYVSDSANNVIRRISPGGVVTTLAGNGTPGFADGPGTSALFNHPIGLAVDRDGFVYVTDSGNSAIRRISPDGVVTTLSAGAIAYPVGVAVDGSGVMHVVDAIDHRIFRIGPDGSLSTLTGSATPGLADGALASALFSFPNDVAVDRNGFIHVVDLGNNRIRRLAP